MDVTGSEYSCLRSAEVTNPLTAVTAGAKKSVLKKNRNLSNLVLIVNSNSSNQFNLSDPCPPIGPSVFYNILRGREVTLLHFLGQLLRATTEERTVSLSSTMSRTKSHSTMSNSGCRLVPPCCEQMFLLLNEVQISKCPFSPPFSQ